MFRFSFRVGQGLAHPTRSILAEIELASAVHADPVLLLQGLHALEGLGGRLAARGFEVRAGPLPFRLAGFRNP